MEVVAIQPFGFLDEAEQALVTKAFHFVGDASELRVYEIRPPTGRQYRLVAPAHPEISVGSQVASAEDFGGVLGVNTEARHVQIHWASRLVVV